MTPAEIQAVADAVWGKQFPHTDATGKADTSPHTAAQWVTGSKPILDAIGGIPAPPSTVPVLAAINALPKPPSVGSLVAAVITAMPPSIALTPDQVQVIADTIAARVPSAPSFTLTGSLEPLVKPVTP